MCDGLRGLDVTPTLKCGGLERSMKIWRLVLYWDGQKTCLRGRLSGVLVWYLKGSGKNGGRRLRFEGMFLDTPSLGGTF